MRELATISALLAAAMAVVWLALFQAHDTATLTPPPEAATETFAREITTRRFDLALRLLAAGTRRTETPVTLESRFASLFGKTGTINHVDAELRWRDGNRAAASAIVKGDDGTVSFDVELQRERGLWKITALPDLQ